MIKNSVPCAATWLMAVLVTSFFAVSGARAEAPPDFFCGTYGDNSNSGLVEAGDTKCSDGNFAAKADHGTILCKFITRCAPVTPAVKSAIKSITNRDFADLSDDERYQIIFQNNNFDLRGIPNADVECRVKSDPCKPHCPGVNVCADPSKSGAVRFLRVLPIDGRPGQGVEASVGGAVHNNPKNSNGSDL